MTARDIRVLQQQRNELSNQLNSATGRRDGLAQELSRAPEGILRQGIEERIRVLDQRILQIESDIATTGRQLAMAPRQLIAETSQPSRPPFGGMEPRQLVPLAGIAFSMFVLAPLAFAMARRIWRGSPPAVVQRDRESDQRLERIEQAVDAIAIEIERISESQRYQNKLLGEGAGASFAFTQQRVGEAVERR
jgi:hypothetical protein